MQWSGLAEGNIADLRLLCSWQLQQGLAAGEWHTNMQ
jgi:hypothetical protein